MLGETSTDSEDSYSYFNNKKSKHKLLLLLKTTTTSIFIKPPFSKLNQSLTNNNA